jgi:hypothetical protein
MGKQHNVQLQLQLQLHPGHCPPPRVSNQVQSHAGSLRPGGGCSCGTSLPLALSPEHQQVPTHAIPPTCRQSAPRRGL